MAASELAIIIRAKDEYSREFGKASRGARGLGDTMKNALRAGALAGGVALVGAGVFALKAAGDFNAAFNTIKSGTGATGDVLEELKGDFKAVFKSVPTDMASAASAIADFNTLTGATGKTLQQLAIRGLEAAKALGEEGASLIDQAGKTIQRMNLEGQDAIEFMDELFVASQNTGVPMTQLASILNAYGPVLTNLGFGLTKQIALFGSLQKSGLEVSRVMPGINAFMRRLASEGVTDLSAAMFDVFEQMEAATTQAEALNIAAEAFGAEGAQRLVVAVRSGALEFGDLVKAMDASEGAIGRNADATRSLGDRFTLFKNNVLVALEPLLTKLFKGLEDALIRITPWLEERLPGAVAAVEDAIEAVTPFVETFATGLQTVFDTAKPLFEFIINNKPVLVGAIAAIGVAIAFAFGPVSAAVLAITGLILLIGLINSKWEDLSGAIGGILNRILVVIEGFANGFVTAINAVLLGIETLSLGLLKLGRIGPIDITPFNDPFGPPIGPLPPGFQRPPPNFDLPPGIGPAVGPLPPGFVRPGGTLIDAELIAAAVRQGIREGNISTNIFIQNVTVEGDPVQALEGLLGLSVP